MRRSLFVCAILTAGGVARADGPVPLIPELAEKPRPPAPAPAPSPAAAAPAQPAGKPQLEGGGGTDWMATLGSLERLSVKRTLAARGYVLDPEPTGKVIADVHIVNEDVFAEDNWLQFFNHFHYTTRESAIKKELVIGKGEVWDQERVDETARRLRDPLYTTVVAVLPVRAAQDPEHQVDLLVVTRDVWSLRLNTKYAFYVDDKTKKLTNLTISLSENNFLGTRAVVALGMSMDQGEIATGPIFINKNLFGEHISLSARADAIYNRDALLDDGHLTREGSDSSISLSKPLWSLASKWAWGVSFAHTYAISRAFQGASLFGWQDPDTGAIFPRVYQYKNIVAGASVTRQWGGNDLKQQLAIGYEVTSARSNPFGFEGTDQERADFIAAVLPRTELTSGPYISYSGYMAHYKTLRNISTYDLGEDARFGPDYSTTLAFGSKALGGDRDYVRASGSAGITIPWCRDGFIRPSASVSMRRETDTIDGHHWIDNTAGGTLRFASPTWYRARLVLQTSLSTRWNETQNRYYTIGQDSGLRGFVIDEFTGQRVFSTQAELRTLPWPIWVFRAGAVAFYELGGAANDLAHMPLHQDVGAGLRALIPQTSREVFRFDFAVPLDGTAAGKLRFIAGFESAF